MIILNIITIVSRRNVFGFLKNALKQVAISKKTTEQPSVEDVEIQSDENDLLLFEPDERVK